MAACGASLALQVEMHKCAVEGRPLVQIRRNSQIVPGAPCSTEASREHAGPDIDPHRDLEILIHPEDYADILRSIDPLLTLLPMTSYSGVKIV